MKENPHQKCMEVGDKCNSMFRTIGVLQLQKVDLASFSFLSILLFLFNIFSFPVYF